MRRRCTSSRSTVRRARASASRQGTQSTLSTQWRPVYKYPLSAFVSIGFASVGVVFVTITSPQLSKRAKSTIAAESGSTSSAKRFRLVNSGSRNSALISKRDSSRCDLQSIRPISRSQYRMVNRNNRTVVSPQAQNTLSGSRNRIRLRVAPVDLPDYRKERVTAHS